MKARAIARPNPWLFPDDAVFPVVSVAQHPLKRLARRQLYHGTIAAMGLHLAVFGAWLFRPHPVVLETAMPGRTVVIRPEQIAPPPPIVPAAARAAEMIETAIRKIASGLPVPIPDWKAPPDVEFASPGDIRVEPVNDGQLVGPNDTLVFPEESLAADPAPGVYVAHEEEPIPIVTPPPVYPEMARAAEVDGVVQVLALIGIDGRVEKVTVVDGPPMLTEAAAAAVSQWRFRPAMQQHQPVKVWVAIPIRFQLH